MLTIAKLFGKSPFSPLQTHMDKVASCVTQLPSLFKALLEQDEATLQKISEQICRLEHEADLTKNDIRNHLPKSLFLPVERSTLLEILSLQDSIADQAEKIALHCCFAPISIHEDLRPNFLLFCQKNIEGFWLVRGVIKELDELLECSFGGIEAEKVKGMVEQIALFDHEVSRLAHELMRALYRETISMAPREFHLLLAIIQNIATLAHLCESLGNRIRMLLELK